MTVAQNLPCHPPYLDSLIVSSVLSDGASLIMVFFRGSNRVTYRRRHSYHTLNNRIKAYVHLRFFILPRGYSALGSFLLSLYCATNGNFLSLNADSVRTPGGSLVAQYLTKRAKGPKCSDCDSSIQGVSLGSDRLGAF